MFVQLCQLLLHFILYFICESRRSYRTLRCTSWSCRGDCLVRQEMYSLIVSCVERFICWLLCYVSVCFFVRLIFVFLLTLCIVHCGSVEVIVLYVKRCTRWLYHVSRDVFIMFRLFANSCALLFSYTIGINCFTWYRLSTATSGDSHILDRV